MKTLCNMLLQKNNNADCIVTRNTKDFEKSEISVYYRSKDNDETLRSVKLVVADVKYRRKVIKNLARTYIYFYICIN